MDDKCVKSALDNNKNNFPINSFPDEVLLKIFSYLEIDDLCLTIINVCKRWNSLSSASILWKSKWLVCDSDMSDDCIVCTLSNAPSLQAIELQWRTNDLSPIIENLCYYCKKINKVNLKCCGNLKSDIIASLFSTYPLLEWLSLEKCWSVQDSCCDMLHNFVNLKSLNISHSRHFSGKTLKEIVDFCPSILHLNIDYVRGIMDNDLLYLVNKRGCDLLSLIVFGECLTDLFFSSLKKCKKLKKLHISKSHSMTKIGLKSIENLSNLISLKLRSGTKLSPEDLNIFLCSKAVSNLRYLCLSRSYFTDESASVTANNCKYLRQLDLVYCPNLTESGRQILYSKCLQLESLNFTEDVSLARQQIMF